MRIDSMKRLVTRLTVAVLLAWTASLGTGAQAEDCGGYCGYGDTYTLLSDCDEGSCSYVDLGGGECTISGMNCSGGSWSNVNPSAWDLEVDISGNFFHWKSLFLL